MKMLDDLKEVLEVLKKDDFYAFKFVEQILIQKEDHPKRQLTGRQFKYLTIIHNRYANRRLYAKK